jgi:hypothetical protein
MVQPPPVETSVRAILKVFRFDSRRISLYLQRHLALQR